MSHHSPRSRQQPGVAEYLLIIALVAVIIIGALVLLGPFVANLITTFNNSI
jgi:Flp pilus assembly pilin Flp